MDFNLQEIIRYYINELKNNQSLTDIQRQSYQDYLNRYADATINQLENQ